MTNFPKKIDLAILGAVPLEVDKLFQLISPCQVFRFHGETFRLGTYRSRSLLIGTTGIGKVNAAVTIAALLERLDIGQLWNIGCAGAYPESPLEVGDVLITRNAICGDEGVLTPEGIVSSRAIGIPIAVHEEQELYDHIPLDHHSLFSQVLGKMPEGLYRLAEGPLPAPAYPCNSQEIGEALREVRRSPAKPVLSSVSSAKPRSPGKSHTPSGFRLHYGPSLTVGMVSGDVQVASERFHRYGAFAESMEGSAAAQACLRFDVSMVECRGISNRAGDRSKARWDLKKAMAHCHGILMNWLVVESPRDFESLPLPG